MVCGVGGYYVSPIKQLLCDGGALKGVNEGDFSGQKITICTKRACVDSITGQTKKNQGSL